MLTEGACDLCGAVLIPEVNYATLARSGVLICGHCDRPHTRSGCDKCDVIFAWAPADIEQPEG
jgi:hypothetical protein